MAFELDKGQQFCLPLGNKLLHSKVWKSLSRVRLLATPWLSSKEQELRNTYEDVEKKEPPYTIGENVNCYSHCGKQYGVSLRK